jgi:hypothetical protein
MSGIDDAKRQPAAAMNSSRLSGREAMLSILHPCQTNLSKPAAALPGTHPPLSRLPADDR